MKKIFILIAAVIASCVAEAGAPVYTDYLVNETGLAYSNTFAVDLNNKAGSAVNQLSMQAVVSSASVAGITFTDGGKSTATITVASNTTLAVRNSTDSITVAADAALAPQKASATVTVSSYTALGGAVLIFKGVPLIEGRDWHVMSTASGTVVSLAAAMTGSPGVTISTGGLTTVIYATATVAGLGGNAFTLVSSTPSALAVSGANFSGGTTDALLNASVTVNGTVLRNGYQWNSVDPATGLSVSTRAAASLATAMGFLTGVSAQAVGSVVTTTATLPGTIGNTFTLASSTSALAVASALFTGGRDTATITMDGVTLKNGVDWTAGTTSTATAKAISDAIQANPTLSGVISSTWNASGVVTATSTISGTAANFPLSSLTSALTTVGFTGGSTSAINLTADTITSASNHFTLGMALLYSTSTGVSPTPLTGKTTYYAIPVDANTFKLAVTSTSAIAGIAIDITAQTATGGGSFGLTPLALTGTPAFKWQESNDSTNWNDVNVSSFSFGSPYTSTTTFWDFGQVNMRYLRVNYTAGTAGAVAITIKANGKG